MQQDFGDDYITITDEDGQEYELEVLTTLSYNGSVYYALVPAGASDSTEELEVNILKAAEEDGESYLCAIDDEQELEEVYEKMMDMLYEDDPEEE